MEPCCPRCGKDFVRLSHRQGTIEQFLSLVYVYPFRCQLCTHRFRALQWGTRYTIQPVGQHRYERIPVRIPASFSGDQTKGRGVLTDLSMMGGTVETDATLTSGALLQVSFQPSERDPHMTVEAAVVRSIRAASVGLEFLRVQSADQESLRQFVFRILSERRA